MKNITAHIASIAAGCAVTLAGCDSRNDSASARDSQTAPTRTASTTQADNTGRNRADSERDAKTPMDQSQSSDHVQLTADVRRAILAEDSLSMGAKNCKIITDKSGRVWLRGAVNTQAEKEMIERIARRIAGEDTVTNQLEVKTD